MDVQTECLRLLLAVLLAALIGLERELGSQPAGFRTHMLVGMGAALFTIVGAGVGLDPTRIAAQVVTGIGFLGAGAIIYEGGGVRGLTTAASLWVTAALGVACGLGFYVLASLTAGVALAALTLLKLLEREFFPRRRGHVITLTLGDQADLAETMEAVKALIDAPVKLTRIAPASGSGTLLVLSSALAHHFSRLDLAISLRQLQHVTGVEIGA